MRLLRNLITVDNCQALLREFVVSRLYSVAAHLVLIFVQDYTDDVDETLIAGSIRGIGQIARTLPESTTPCLNALTACIKSPHGRPPFPCPPHV
jgi:hypothetical protein